MQVRSIIYRIAKLYSDGKNEDKAFDKLTIGFKKYQCITNCNGNATVCLQCPVSSRCVLINSDCPSPSACDHQCLGALKYSNLF